MPKLLQLYGEIKDREDVIVCGIALERPEDVEKLNGIIRELKLEWLNVWSESANIKKLDSPHGRLKIRSFPSYVILDKEGKIVFTPTDKKYDSHTAIDFFKKLISNK